ncbi:MAG: flagellin [Lachnospiraceae bacterium]|nr:flagellin [Lachnospiraceae bacterium]
MVVQHNMQAMNSSRMLGITTNAQAKSTEKLSSGYKINRAADDAAGLSISEKMRKQMRGLDRASTNAQDGVSAVQTAEGALTEVHDMLQRMNELAVQASNGTNSQSDRESIQNEVDQLTTEIDRVSETTKFNEMYLLKGNSDPSQTKTVTMTGHDAGLDKLRDATNYNNEIADQNNSSLTTFSFTVDMDKLGIGKSVNIGGKDYTIIESVADNATEDASKSQYHKSNIDASGYLSNDDTKITQGRALQLIGQALGQANYIGDDGTDTATISDAGATTAANVKFKSNAATTDKWKDGAALSTTIGTTKLQDAAAADTNNVTFFVEKASNTVQQALNFNLHVGADADMNNKIGVGIEEMNSKYLGVKGLDVVGKDSDGNNTNDGGIAATYAIDAIADAVAKVSAQRSSLGAVQNRLEHTINNVDNVVENTTAAESRIRDTDMADEMVTYSKNNILAQAGQSMLAQANQSTQGVLSLLG